VTQLALFSAPPPAARPRPATGKRPSITERWEEFHAANPHVMDQLMVIALARLERGAKRVGVKALWEECRENLRVKKLGEYRLNNDFTALYARRMIELEPRLEGVIELRKRKAK